METTPRLSARGRPADGVLGRVQDLLGMAPDLVVRDGLLVDGQRNRLPRDAYLERLAFYLDDRFQRGGAFFAGMPDRAPAHRAVSRRPFGSGEQVALRFPSSYRTVQPALAAQVAAFAANRDAWLVLWRHEAARPRPLVLCAHGFLMGDPARAAKLFRVERLFGLGLDVALFVQPHHGPRADRPGNPFRQRFINPHDVPLTLEAVGQAVHDLRSCVLLLRQDGYERIGLVGASLGGYACALYAAVDGGPDFAFLAAPALRLDRALAPRRIKLGFAVDDEVRRTTRLALDVVAPANYPPRLAVDDIAVVYHRADRVAEASSTVEWIERWRIQHVTELRGGHFTAFDRKARGRAFYGWLGRHGYLPSSGRSGEPT